jgi:alpha-beta hydrolase superfamily lysophospholipase
MKNGKTKRKLRSILVWAGWVLLIQFILINISAALYAYKFTHLHFTTKDTWNKPPTTNVFSKTWRLFAGPTMYKQTLKRTPLFSYSAITLKTGKNIPIEAWYSKSDSIALGTVILFHGLTSNRGDVVDEATAFRDMGYNVLLLDNRNHGTSGGNITTIGYRESEEVKLAYDHIQEAGEKNIFLWGTSMGAVQILKAISDYQLKPSGIIIEMPFLSLQSHLKGRARTIGFPKQPFAFLTTFWIGIERGFNGFGFKSVKYAKNIKCPVLEQYGEKDDLVLKDETTTIFSAIASVNKKLVMYDDAGHESFLRKDPVMWKREIASFFQQFSKPIF